MSQEDFFTLSIQVQNQTSIHDGLRRLVTGETISDYNCSECKNRVEIEKKVVVEKLPNTLIIHLQRIIFDMDTFLNKKLNSRIEFPNVLNMHSYMKDEVLKADKERIEKGKKEARQRMMEQKQKEMAERAGKGAEDGKDDREDTMMQQMPSEQMVNEDEESNLIGDQDMKEEEPPENFEYKLVGVVLHMGTADAGHYLSYINTNRG
jgi:ubiquitin C-terminal hydrolase